MAANRKNKNTLAQRPPRRNVWLSLTLVPIIAGVVLIIAWAMDWELLGDLENQHFLGLLFILAGFAFSNLVQRKWILAAGWGLITVSDFLLLTLPGGPVQIAALVLAALGLALLAFEFYRQFQRNQANS